MNKFNGSTILAVGFTNFQLRHVRIREMEGALTADGSELFDKHVLASVWSRCIEGIPGVNISSDQN